MRLLLFSDLHADASAAQSLVDRSHSVDVVVGAGDFGNMRRQIGVCVDVLRAMDRPAVLVPGNAESVEELAEACRGWEQAHVLHGTGVVIGGVPFFGLGGAVPVTPFGSWSYDFTEERAAELLADCPAGGVLVSHSPPKGAVDVSSRGSMGSTAVRDTVLSKHPMLVVCGHIHASAGQHALLDHAPVVNAGPAGIEWELRGSG
jgi:Icc-related predicted phosphoesterase